MDDTYLTINRESQAEIKVKGSRFIGESFLVSGSAEAMERLQSVRKREHAATHHCFAYHIGTGSEISFKYSDDGEPSGSAGKPMYDVILGAELTNVLVVVTRYFGGTKLGTGGLVRAYGDAARRALDKSGLKTNYLTHTFHVELDFTRYNQLRQIMTKLDVDVLNSEFSDTVTLDVAVRLSRSEAFQSEFTELTQGKGHLEQTQG